VNGLFEAQGMTRESALANRLRSFLAAAGGWLAAAWLLTPTASAQTNSQQIYLQCLTNFETYAETIWHTSATIPDSGYWGDGGSTGNGGIRGNSGIAVAYAVLAVALPNDPRFTNRIARVRQALNYDYNTHVTGSYNTTSGNKWGWSGVSTDWQTPEWSGSMGLACILVQSNLPAATLAGVRTVIVSEADHRSGIAPASGHVSDTKAEENAWQGNILALAAAWMNTSNHAPTWLAAAESYLANTYTTSSSAGDPLAGSIITYNLYNDWALENHGFFHPTYEMVAGMSSGDSLLMAKLADPTTASQLMPYAGHNVMAAWTNVMAGMVMDSGDFAYPAGLDWELHDYEQYSFIAWMAAHFNDPLARWADLRLAQLTRYRQIVNDNDATSPANYGTFVGASGGGFYREAVEARRAAICWLQWANADYPDGPTGTPMPCLENLTDVAVLTCRGTNGFIGISYGPQTNGSPSRIMATIEPVCAGFASNTIVTTPRLPGIIGLGAMGSPTGARLVNLVTNGIGFTAELQVTNGANGTTEVYFDNTGDSVGVVEVPRPANGFANSAAASFSTGIENDPLCGGSRLLEWGSGSATITNRSGAARNMTNGWVCVSGHYGLAAGPAGYFNYTAAGSYNRLGAAEDTLAFMPTNSLAPRYAVYFPGRTALQTSNLAAQVAWTVSGANVALTFPAAGGVARLSAPVTVASINPSYPPYSLAVAGIAASSYQAGFPAANAVDGNFSDYWVSSGTVAGQGPTPSHPEWLLVTFPRPVAISEFSVYPRTDNGGYGPKDVQMLLNGAAVATNSMSPTATLDVKLFRPVDATNAMLYITSSYYRGSPVNPQNVQVDEMVFFERAPPGTFADWQLQNFTDAQLTNSAIGTATADPDGDGVPNLLEFASGGDPLVPDATNAAVAGGLDGGEIALRFQERHALGNVQRQFEASGDFVTWTNISPIAVQPLKNFGVGSLYQATFPLETASRFFRIQYSVTN
jgi:hypothetical protein